jgi:hypothetical protein
MFNYVLLYFAVGLPVAVAFMLAGKEDTPLPRRLLAAFVLWLVWPFIPVAIIRERLALKQINIACAWCGEAVAPLAAANKREIWKAHHLQCPKHPLREEIERAKSERDFQIRQWGKEHANANRFRDALDEIVTAAGVEWWDGEPPVEGVILILQKLHEAEKDASWVGHWRKKYEEANAEAFDYKAKWEHEVANRQGHQADAKRLADALSVEMYADGDTDAAMDALVAHAELAGVQ